MSERQDSSPKLRAKYRHKSGRITISIVLGMVMGQETFSKNKERVEARSSEKERRVDAKALIADEGRDKLR